MVKGHHAHKSNLQTDRHFLLNSSMWGSLRSPNKMHVNQPLISLNTHRSLLDCGGSNPPIISGSGKVPPLFDSSIVTTTKQKLRFNPLQFIPNKKRRCVLFLKYLWYTEFFDLCKLFTSLPLQASLHKHCYNKLSN